LSRRAGSGSILIDIGSGNNRVHPLVTNIDILPYDEVDIVADACVLPIESGCVDAIVSETSLEHIPNSDAALAECSRVLKVGGLIFIVVPFMQPLHAAPMDYKRWTIGGLKEDLAKVGIEVVGSGIAAGPASAFSWILAEFVSTILSLGSRRVRRAISLPIQALFSPIKWLDVVLSRLPTSDVLPSAIWVEGVKLQPKVGKA
jgi:SAM-dependent methyltransferase